MNSISRRAFVESLAAAVAAASPASTANARPALKDGRFVSRKTENGLVPIEWIDIEEGMDLIAFDWEGGYLVGITAFTADSVPDLNADGQPVGAVDGVRFIDCRTYEPEPA